MESPIWHADNPQRYKPLHGEARADVAVVGGGITGLTAAYLLCSSGVGVAVLEAGKIGSGASGRCAAMGTVQQGLCFARLVRLYGQGRAAEIVKAYQGAVHLIAGIAAKEGFHCDISVQDSYVFTTDTRRAGAVEREVDLASRFGLDAGLTNIAPFLLPYRVAACVRGQITLNPAQYMAGLAGTIVAKGGVIF
jgi:glycine/D-amino acid oxidase-like deaminating enzyme